MTRPRSPAFTAKFRSVRNCRTPTSSPPTTPAKPAGCTSWSWSTWTASLPSLPAPASGLAGTPDFMAPEQAHGRPTADTRSDLYSLGCTFYYLLTGQPPFPGGTWSEKLLRHQFDAPPPVTKLRPEVP